MANSWFRFYAEFEDDPKVQMMPENMQRRLAMLFCERCKEEKRTEAQRAFKWHISMSDLSETKTLFLELGFIDDKWNLENWNKRQFLSDSSTDRVRKFRANHVMKQDETLHETEMKQDETLQVVTVKQSVTPPDTDTDSDTEQKQRKAVARGTRLPADFSPNESHKVIATQRNLSLEWELASFRDYWNGISGQRGTKLDWAGAFRNWLRSSRNGNGNGLKLQKHDPLAGMIFAGSDKQ